MDPNQRDPSGDTPIMHLLRELAECSYLVDANARHCLQVLVNNDRVDLNLKDPVGRSLEDLAR